LDEVGIFADGVAVQQVGQHTFPIVRATVSEIIRVTNDEICAAIKDVFDDTRTIVEPAGALAVAGVKAYVQQRGIRNQRLAAVLSGANMNFDRLRFVAERAELGEGHETLLAVTIPERPGAFREFCGALGARVITEFNYRLSGRDRAQIFVGVSTRSRDEGETLVLALREGGYETADLSRNGTWSAAARRTWPRSASAVSNSRSGPARCCSFSTPSAGGGTSACFTTAITARTSDACSRVSKSRIPTTQRSRRFYPGSATGISWMKETKPTSGSCPDAVADRAPSHDCLIRDHDLFDRVMRRAGAGAISTGRRQGFRSPVAPRHIRCEALR
jgi:threonine dehydratase